MRCWLGWLLLGGALAACRSSGAERKQSPASFSSAALAPALASAPARRTLSPSPPPQPLAEPEPFLPEDFSDQAALPENVAWARAHRRALWAHVAKLPSGVPEVNDMGCAELLKLGEQLGPNLAGRRQAVRHEKDYFERVGCQRQAAGYQCELAFGLDGDPETEFTISVVLLVRADATLLNAPAKCALAG
jgi:hypothetical protein